MGERMRRLIRFRCGDDRLSGSIDEAAGTTGLLCVTGGSQIRAGPHRMLHRLASEVAATGVPVFRYDRRGVGDSGGDDPGYRGSAADLIAAAEAFRTQAPRLNRVVGFGLCDGATTLALHGRQAGIDALALANPWLVETAPNTLAPAAARAHYRDRLFSPSAWKGIATGKVDLLAAARSIASSLVKPKERQLADEVAIRLEAYVGKLLLILASRDGTAIAAKDCWNAEAFSHVRGERIVPIDSDSHTFARAGDFEQLSATIIALTRRMSDSA